MPIAQRAYEPLEKYIIFQPTGITWNSSGDTASLNIQSNDDWNIVADGWIQLSRYEEEHRGPIEAFNTLSGNGNTIIGIRCSENTGNTRTGGITGYCQSNSAISATTTVIQSGSYVKPYLALDKYIVDMPDSGMSGVTLIVNSNIDWITSTDSRWIDIDTTSGSSSGTIVFNVSQSDQSLERRGSIYVSGITEDIYAECVVAQSGVTAQTPYIIIVPTSQNVPTSGDSFVITVSSNTSWDVSIVTSGSTGDSRTWITTNVLNGYGDDEVRVNVAPMVEEGTGRTGYISFHNDIENLKTDCNITQEDVDNTKILYTSSDGNVIWILSDEFVYGTTLLSNTYENGVGILSFSGDVTNMQRKNILSYHNLQKLTSITLPNTLQSIGEQVFNGATGLTSIVIPDSVTTMGNDVFHNCYSLTSVTFGTGMTYIPEGCFMGSVPASASNIDFGVVQDIRSQSFYGSLYGDLVIPNTVTNLGYASFLESHITSVTIPSSVASFYYSSVSHSTSGNVFNGCTDLRTVNYETSRVPSYCFTRCSGLTTVYLGENVNRIDNYAFNNCINLVDIYSYNPTAPTLNGNNIFSGNTSNGTLHYPQGSDYSTFINKLPYTWTAVADL